MKAITKLYTLIKCMQNTILDMHLIRSDTDNRYS